MAQKIVWNIELRVLPFRFVLRKAIQIRRDMMKPVHFAASRPVRIHILFTLLCIVCVSSTLSSQSFQFWSEHPTEAEYIQALRLVDGWIFQREFEYPFLLLLEENARQRYEGLTDLDARKKFIETYWKVNDPDPLLEQNEWLVEFVRRCAYVREHFYIPREPFFDDRGRYYLKFGEPKERATQLAGTYTVTLLGNIEFQTFIAQLAAVTRTGDDVLGHTSRYYQVYGNETWVYPAPGNRPGDEAVIHFIQEGEGYRASLDLSDALAGLRNSKNRVWYWSDMVKKRAMQVMTPQLVHASEDIINFEEDLWAAFEMVKSMEGTPNGGLGTGTINLPGNIIAQVANPVQKLSQKEIHHESLVHSALTDMPVSSYTPEKAANVIQMDYAMSQFRGANGKTRVEFSLLAPLRDNLVETEGAAFPDVMPLSFSCLLEDSLFNPVQRDRTLCAFPVQQALKSGVANASGCVGVYALPQTGMLTVQVADTSTGRVGYLRQSVDIRDFRGEALQLSDIQLLAELEHPETQKYTPVLIREEMAMTPYPFVGIRNDIPVYCYFEVYNLDTGLESEAYDVTLAVTRQQEQALLQRLTSWITSRDKQSVSLSHTRMVTDAMSRELLGVDFSNLAEGSYQLEITVQDALHPTVATRISRDIVIVD